MERLENISMMLLLALLPFQDSGLQKGLRTIGASLSVFPLVLILLLCIARRMHAVDWRVPRMAVRCVLYTLFLTVIYLFLFGTSVHGDSLIAKSLSLFSILGLFAFGAFGPVYTRSRYVWVGAMAGLAFTLLASFAGPALDSSSLLHNTMNLDARPRGFCTESSTFSVQVVTSGLIAAYCARKLVTKVLLLFLTAGLLVYSGSKGGLISLLLCTSLYWIARSQLSPLKLLGGAVLLLPMGYFVSGLISQGFENDMISNGSSVATRATMLLFSFNALLHNPFGVGVAGFYPALARYLPAAMEGARSIFDFPLVFNEVSTYRYAIENADCKTFFLDLMVFFGLPFVVLFFSFFFRMSRRLYGDGEHILLIGALFACIALLSYYSTLNAYSIPVLIGFCLSSQRHEKAALRQCA